MIVYCVSPYNSPGAVPPSAYVIWPSTVTISPSLEDSENPCGSSDVSAPLGLVASLLLIKCI